MALEIDSEARHYGTSCAARALGLSKHYSARDAEQLIVDVGERDRRRALLAKAKLDARRQADSSGESVLVCRSRSGLSYYTVRGSAFDANPGRYSTPVATLQPEQNQSRPA